MAKRERIKNYVIHLLEKQGWTVKKEPTHSVVDLIATRANGDRRGFLIKPHGHISKTEIAAIHEYEETKGIGVVHVHEGSNQEILFSRMYKYLKKR